MRKEETNPNNPRTNENEGETNEGKELKSRTISQSNCRVRDSKEKQFREE